MLALFGAGFLFGLWVLGRTSYTDEYRLRLFYAV